ncbi:right-handed parallel beta-helix repeat-containing protein [Adhaeribacter sp. BT258]|uniref:Right-handed parallel beta-helix repeat-containing protein n=1 Tax=Adhaeribacter terrigena TaxID=2793070 RepID=A0ABS1C4S9_9BACT|nr:right-handed parallel beta-helix repeat-containing protein [Adhaeribacter terrigena]MBK0403535.1 right-handed parallel beta-helix repeat-containing protein [Adhaeribacter terrigena]
MFSFKKLALFVLPAALIFTSCKEEDAPKPNPNPGTQPVNNLPALVLTNVLADTVLQDRNTDPAKADYLVNSNIRIDAKLTLKPGVVIGFAQDARVDLNTTGSLIAKGTAEKKIRFIGQTAQKGFWSGIIIYSAASVNEISHAEILHAGSKAMLDNQKTAVALFENARVSVSNSTVSQSGGFGMYLRDNSIPVTFANNVFSYNQEAPLQVAANHVAVLDEASIYTNNNGRNAVEVRGSLLTGNNEITWPAFTDGTPIRFLATVGIRTGWKLKPGTTIEMAEDKQINIETNGYLNAVGTAAKKIVFTGTVKATGTWNGLVVYTRSALNVLDHVKIQHAGGKALFGGTKAAIGLFGTSATSLEVRNSEISQSGGYGIHVFGNKGVLNADVETVNTFTGNTQGNVYYEI